MYSSYTPCYSHFEKSDFKTFKLSPHQFILTETALSIKVSCLFYCCILSSRVLVSMCIKLHSCRLSQTEKLFFGNTIVQINFFGIKIEEY